MATRRRSGWKIDPGNAAQLYGSDPTWRETFDLAVKTAKLEKITLLREQAKALGLQVVDPGEVATQRKKPGPKPGSVRKAKPGPKPKAPSGNQVEAITKALKGAGWVNTIALSKEVGFKVADTINKMISDGSVKKQGERRSTSYKLA